MSVSALYSKHRRDPLVAPGINWGVNFLRKSRVNPQSCVAAECLGMVTFDESLSPKNRTRHYFE